MLVKVLAQEGHLSSGSNVDNATVVRLYNSHGSAAVITRKLGDSIKGSLTVAAGEVIYLEKEPTETLSCNLGENGSSVKVTKIAYGN